MTDKQNLADNSRMDTMKNLETDYLDEESQMIAVKNFEDFAKYNIGDVKRIISSRYKNAITPYTTLEDMTQDLMLHLLRNKSIEKFDPSRGVKFSTYIYGCIHYYLLSFPLRKTNRTHVERNCMDYLDEVFPGGSKLSDYIGSYEVDVGSSIDLERVRDFVVKLDVKKGKMKFKSKVSYTAIFDMLVSGYREREIAKKHKVTQTCIAMKRKELIDLAREELGLMEEAPFF